MSSAASAATPVSPTTTRVRRSPAPRTRVPGASGRCRRPAGARRAAGRRRRRRARPGSPRPPRRRASGHDVVRPRARATIGGQIALAGSAPVHEETARSLARNYERLLAGGVDLRLGVEADAGVGRRARARRGRRRHRRRPYDPATDRRGERSGLGRARRRRPRRPAGGRGGLGRRRHRGSPARSCSPAAGTRSRSRVASVAVGEALHQYPRNLYLAAPLPRGRPCRAPPRARRRRRRAGPLPQPLRPRARGRRSRPTRSCSRSAGFPRAGSPRAPRRAASRSRRRATASARGRSRRRSSKVRSRSAGSASLRSARDPDRSRAPPDIRELKARVAEFLAREVYPLEQRVAEAGRIDPEWAHDLRKSRGRKASAC